MALLALLAVLAAPPVAAPVATTAPLPSIDTELEAAAAWLGGRVAAGAIAPHDARYYRFFTTYAVPPRKLDLGGLGVPGIPAPATLRAAAPYVLSFVLNSLAACNADGPAVPPLPVAPTLYAIDIRDYGWDVARFEAAIATDPYVVEPLVDPFAYAAARVLAGNVLVRADWFCVHATDARKQIDRGLVADAVIYYTLIYGVGRRPRTLDDFRRAWFVDAAAAERALADSGAVVDRGKSGVSHGARRLIGLRTVRGEYWETRDAANEDYVENVFSDNFEAGEAITVNGRDLQVYLLFNGKKQVVEDGDIKLVEDATDARDPRVRTASSCIVCHPLGINEARNEVAAMVREGVKIHEDYPGFLRKLQRTYLAGKFDVMASQASGRYAAAVAACNGLAAAQNAAAFKALYDWYAYEDVTLEQAAAEAGLPAAAYRNAIVNAASGRLAALYRYGKPVPRPFWEASVVGGKVAGGAYAEGILHIKGRTAALITAGPPPVPGRSVVTVTAATARVLDRRTVRLELPAGATLTYLGESGDWVAVRYGDVAGHIRRSQCRIDPGRD